MKKSLLLVSALFSSTILYAQLKVNEDGNLMLGYDISQNPVSAFSIGSKGHPLYQMYVQTNELHPFGLYVVNDVAQKAHTGLCVISAESENNPATSIKTVNYATDGNFSVGIESEIRGTPAQAVALSGIIRPTMENGIAVYGGVGMKKTIHYPGTFAGYFFGDILTTGNIYGKLLSNYPITLSQASNTDYSDRNNITKIEESSPIIDKLSNLKILSYQEQTNQTLGLSDAVNSNNDQTSYSYDTFNTGTIPSSDEINTYEDNNNTVCESMSDTRYFLDINTLSEYFPEFVYHDKVGNIRIDYVGMIPLLVKSIAELREYIYNLELNHKIINKSNQETTSNIKNITSNTSTEIELKQNIPNPFNTSTKIPITLPENVKDASICIYDLSGKLIKKISIKERGLVQININAQDFYHGVFLYSLITDGRCIDTKKLIIM